MKGFLPGRAKACAIAILLALSLSAEAEAHSRSHSFSTWTAEADRLEVTLDAPARLVSALMAASGPAPSFAAALAAHMSETLSATRNGAPCRPAGLAQPLSVAEGRVRAELGFVCEATQGPVTLTVDAFFGAIGGAVHVVRFRHDGNWDERVLTAGARIATFEADAEQASAGASDAFANYFRLGVEHILGGPDHLAFVLALMLAASGWRQVLALVTGFTLGHSLTLALAATGRVVPEPMAVEALIGATIALVAVEAALGEAPERFRKAGWASAAALALLWFVSVLNGGALPWLVWLGLIVFVPAYAALAGAGPRRGEVLALITVAFGLVHGFGFAGALMEIGLPEERLVLTLFAFNLGVEAGQIAVVVLVAALAAGFARLATVGLRETGKGVSAALLTGLGVFWFVSRAFG